MCRARTQKRVEHLAHHDSLTDLPNRVLFLDRLQQALARARRHKEMAAVINLDLDLKAFSQWMGGFAGAFVIGREDAADPLPGEIIGKPFGPFLSSGRERWIGCPVRHLFRMADKIDCQRLRLYIFFSTGYRRHRHHAGQKNEKRKNPHQTLSQHPSQYSVRRD